MTSSEKENWVALVILLLGSWTLAMAEVTYDGRSLIIDGQRKILFSGSIHYPRSTPQMWPALISKAKEGGLDVIQTYVFWNLHEPQFGQYDFSGRYDLVRFIKEIQVQGLYVCLRIGPYIESEWTYGGFPFWLHDVPAIVYRTDNQPFKLYMQNFTTKIVSMMQSEGLYASQGGPIILSQIENEYQNVEKAFGEDGSRYVQWAAEMAVGLKTGVPWLMCKQTDAPDPLYHGGTNLGRTSSSYVITSYYDQAPLDEYGLLRQPKWGHLKELHAAIKSCSTTLLEGKQSNFSLGQLQEGYVFEEEGKCVAFLVNNDHVKMFTVQFRNRSYELPSKSISILPDCQNVTFNTATVNTKSNRRMTSTIQTFSSADKWEQFQDVIPNFDQTTLISNSLLEQMNVTKDKSDYLWYTLSESKLTAQSAAHVTHAFADGTYLGAFLERRFAGLTAVEIQCSEESYDLTNSTWGYQTAFDSPKGDEPVALNLESMGKGQAWVNGESIGRYWISFHDSKGQPSQTLYHVPRSFLKDIGNSLVLFEEEGGNPLHISLDTISSTNIS
ncbi:hypothetical protein JHK86_020064 [Glycine max]|nr:hypothetical protein JHK86_020064 [Glycine max]